MPQGNHSGDWGNIGPCRKARRRESEGLAERQGRVFQAFFLVPAIWKDVGREDRMRVARQRGEGGPEIVAKARLSGFGLIVELAAGGRGVEARKGIAPDPGDRNAKPRAVRGAG